MIDARALDTPCCHHLDQPSITLINELNYDISFSAWRLIWHTESFEPNSFHFLDKAHESHWILIITHPVSAKSTQNKMSRQAGQALIRLQSDTYTGCTHWFFRILYLKRSCHDLDQPSITLNNELNYDLSFFTWRLICRHNGNFEPNYLQFLWRMLTMMFHKVKA